MGALQRENGKEMVQHLATKFLRDGLKIETLDEATSELASISSEIPIISTLSQNRCTSRKGLGVGCGMWIGLMVWTATWV